MNYNFKLDKRIERKKGFPISIMVSYRGQTKIKSLKRFSDSSCWNEARQRVTKKHPDYLYVNSELDRLDYRFKELMSRNNYRDISKFISDLLEIKEPDNQLLIRDFVADFDFKTKSTKDLYNIVVNDFEKVCGNMPMDEIEKHHIIKYRDYKKKTTNNNGLHTYMATLRTVCYRFRKDPIMFDGLMPKIQATRQKELSVNELKAIFEYEPTSEQMATFKKYACLQFLLGGIDFIDLANLTYKNIKDNRVSFNRGKGGTDAYVSNMLPDLANEIIKSFDSRPYLTSAYKYDYTSHRNNYTKRFSKAMGFYFTAKSMRYTFINIAKDLNVREDLAMQLVGHTERTTHSIYKGRFPNDILDEAHHRVISVLSR